jgi:glycolate oxidase
MQKYNAVTAELLQKLNELLGEKYVATDPEKLDVYKTDEEANTHYHHMPEVVVFPENAEQIAGVMKLANEYLVPVTPRGAGTGLACGAIPIHGGIVLVMDRLNKIIEINEEGLYAVVEAGVRTLDLQNAAKEKGLLYAGDPCSSDSCQIGGNVATNAGGNRVVKYGTTRDQVYAVQVVTPTGDIVDLGARTEKNSTGYCLEKIFVGSEGTLGIITKITLRLVPLPTCRIDFLSVFDDAKNAMNLPLRVLKAGLKPASMEFMSNAAVQQIGRYLKTDLPHQQDGSYIIVTLDALNDDELDSKTEILDGLCEECGAVDVLVADEERIWKARRNHAEATRSDSLVYYAEDIVVPIDKVIEVMNHLPGLQEKYGICATTVAHIGDGNIHVNAMKGELSEDEWDAKLAAFHKDLYSLVYQLGGRLSGEHGIGYKKLNQMEMFTDPKVLNIMRAFKTSIDPNYILNPDKIFKAQ